jgi:hypothetical protein
VLARRPYEGYDSYYDWLAAGYDQKRSILIDALENAGSSSSSSINDSSTDSDGEEKQQQQKPGVFKAIVPNGGFFIMAHTSNIEFPYEEIAKQVTPATPRMAVVKSKTPTKGEATETMMPRDWALSRWLTTTVGVTAIPPSAFYGPDNLHLASDTLRFAFCKNEDTLLEASRRLEDYHFATSSTSSSAVAADAELSS